MLISASATNLQRSFVFLLYLDVILVLVAAVPVLAAGAPVFGYAIGATVWTFSRLVSTGVERKIAAMEDFRRQIGFGVASSMLRVWLLACAIIAAGVAGSRADGLTAALVICGAFSVYFARRAFEHYWHRTAPSR